MGEGWVMIGFREPDCIICGTELTRDELMRGVCDICQAIANMTDEQLAEYNRRIERCRELIEAGAPAAEVWDAAGEPDFLDTMGRKP